MRTPWRAIGRVTAGPRSTWSVWMGMAADGGCRSSGRSSGDSADRFPAPMRLRLLRNCLWCPASMTERCCLRSRRRDSTYATSRSPSAPPNSSKRGPREDAAGAPDPEGWPHGKRWGLVPVWNRAQPEQLVPAQRCVSRVSRSLFAAHDVYAGRAGYFHRAPRPRSCRRVSKPCQSTRNTCPDQGK